MPRMATGPIRGFYLPDYGGASVVNLLASIIRSQGGASPHREHRGVPARRLRGARRLIYLVVDGLGVRQLEHLLEAGAGRSFFGAHDYVTTSTVFPATTAAAVTTLGTGASPAEHGILGWFLNLHDLGLVSTILPAQTRTKVPMVRDDFDLAAYLELPSYVATVARRRELLTYGRIARSVFSRATPGWKKRFSYRTLRGLERQVVSFARRPGRGIAYAYWPSYDTICHTHGCFHRRSVAHFKEIDRSLARLVRRLAGTGTCLVVLADHGLVDSVPAQRVDLARIPRLYDCLATLPAGDARHAVCYVRPAKVGQFRDIVRRRLGRACVCVPAATLRALGAYGPGRPHASLESRAGDFTLLARGGFALYSSLPGGKRASYVGNHGGMSEEEILVPLYVLDL
jgi:hypothetical protein